MRTYRGYRLCPSELTSSWYILFRGLIVDTADSWDEALSTIDSWLNAK